MNMIPRAYFSETASMLTFPVDKELSTHVYLEPVPFLPENPPGRPVTTLSETGKTRLGDAVGLVSAILLEIDPLNIGNYDNEYDSKHSWEHGGKPCKCRHGQDF